MGSRITDGMVQRTALADVMRARLRLARVQEQAASGLRINRPSDDAVGYRMAGTVRSALRGGEQLLRNHGRAETRIARADAALSETLGVLQRARELALQGANGAPSQNAETRRILAEEVAGLHADLLSQANASNAGEHVFAGHANDVAPFVASGGFANGSPAPTVAFVGDSNEIEIEIDSGTRVATSLDGRRVFQGDANGDGLVDGGRVDLFDTLAGLWTALDTNDGAATAAELDRIDTAMAQIHAERTRLAGSSQRIEGARDGVRDRAVALQSQLSQLQDADTVEVFSELVSRETALQASLQAAARVIQPSLLDFLG
ncbi:MAG: flagellin [Myxococcota bacterium]|nr:hypothetical protein [Myxococcales bacterium]